MVSLQQRLSCQAIGPAPLLIARHDGSNDPFDTANLPWSGFGDLDSLLVEPVLGVFPVRMILRSVSNLLVGQATTSRPCSGTPDSAVNRPPKLYL